MNKKRIVAQIKKHKDEIAKRRDLLREIYEDLETEIEAFDNGIRSLEEAIDYISEVV